MRCQHFYYGRIGLIFCRVNPDLKGSYEIHIEWRNARRIIDVAILPQNFNRPYLHVVWLGRGQRFNFIGGKEEVVIGRRTRVGDSAFVIVRELTEISRAFQAFLEIGFIASLGCGAGRGGSIICI